MNKYEMLKYHLHSPIYQDDVMRRFLLNEVISTIEDTANDEGVEITDDFVYTTLIKYKENLQNSIERMSQEDINKQLREDCKQKLHILYEYL